MIWRNERVLADGIKSVVHFILRIFRVDQPNAHSQWFIKYINRGSIKSSSLDQMYLINLFLAYSKHFKFVLKLDFHRSVFTKRKLHVEMIQ